MENMKRVMMVAAWQLGGSHEYLDGVSEYIESSPTMRLQLSTLEMLPSISKWEIGGLITSIPVGSVDYIRACPFPVVSMSSLPELNLPYVDADPDAIGALAADYFLGLGHTQFSVFYYSESMAHRLRVAGFINRLHEKGVQSVGEYVMKPGELESPKGQGKIMTWLRTRAKPSALFCTDDWTGSHVLPLLKEAGFCVPEDISVLGCEDERIFCEHAHPTLSSIRLPYKKAGYEAARLLDQLMQGKSPAQTQLFFPPEQVTVRMSTSTLATSDPRLRKAFGFIQGHSMENITVGQIAQHAGVSVRDLQRRFKKELGRSPKQELHLVRVGRVKELLRKTDFTLPEIAEKTGFVSECWMGTLFRELAGCSPGAYRKKHRMR